MGDDELLLLNKIVFDSCELIREVVIAIKDTGNWGADLLGIMDYGVINGKMFLMFAR